MERIASVLTVAVSTGRIAYVYLENGKPVRWGMSRKAAKSTQNAAQIVKSWIDDFSPDLLISENPETAYRKGAKSRQILETIGELFEAADGLNVRLARVQSYQTKFQEAKALAQTYPELKHLCPLQPPIWMPEPRNVSYFEALSFVEQLKAKPSE